MDVEHLCGPGVNFPFFCIGLWQLRVPPFDDRPLWPEEDRAPFDAVTRQWGTAPSPPASDETCELWYG